MRRTHGVALSFVAGVLVAAAIGWGFLHVVGSESAGAGPAPGASPAATSTGRVATGSGSSGAAGSGSAGRARGGARPPSATSASAPGDGFDAGAPSGDTGAATARSAWPASAVGVGNAVHEALPAIEECYRGWLQVDPELEGRIVVQFTIVARDGEGVVDEAHAVEQTGSGAFDACVTQVMATLEFDPPDGTLAVTYPFLFAIGEDDPP